MCLHKTAIFVIDTIVRGKTSPWWPLIPGVIIAGNAVIEGNEAVFGSIRQVVSDW